MTDKKYGGPAFPQPCTKNGYAANSPFEVAGGGMTLRDYFAARAPDAKSGDLPPGFSTDDSPEWKPYMREDKEAQQKFAMRVVVWHAKRDAIRRYIWADAMLAAREVVV
ncbi:MAG: hypothetical protein ACRC7D_22345 [Aeromonas popoffii]|uniref:hypothetical protein n=1 Tax=Aeromonas popoffii TaxID=70856 RepID=UPI003F2CB69F